MLSHYEKAQKGLGLLKEAILDLIKLYPGLGNSEIAEKLGLHSDYMGGQKDYLTWSVIGLLMNDGAITRTGRKYFVK